MASLATHLAILAGVVAAPTAPWSWLLHAGAVLGFWYMARRLARRGLRSWAGLLRVRRVVPIPVRLTLAAATLNAVGSAALAWAGRGAPGRALSAYWTMMYLLVAIVVGAIGLRLDAPSRSATPPEGG